ncbi:PHB depolymerase family esterase [Paucibacter sp. PLA-PC-4]|uniref:extracellular catalytic domain type 1 short-chain-length polyhydroxyalkanoate depolymerase n=1 Tax=Paucibacter sp. PLA-PC-4 TaxID=2993655 RepID=UPI00224B2E45|nr:PHB depolymerase family esterase [Paucibacter sp. PLA-PC-4]MCX2863426.1 PHB depolymerase family esterase [Paucibacter sp. PLA-PC-4]
MTPSFGHLMTEATRLTRAGDLRAATALIQSALGAAVPSATVATARTDQGDVIDVEAREVWPEALPESNRPAEPAEPAFGQQFLPGSYTGAAGTRAYKLYVPPGYQQGQSLPLVLMLHGCSQDPDDFARGTGMNEAARAQGFLVLYPAQTKHANSSGCWNWFKRNHQRRGSGEPALLAGMTRQVMQQYGVDARRVYVAGLSAGGAMAAILGSCYPELFAAVGVHSGLPAGAASDLPSALAAMRSGAGDTPAPALDSPPIIVFHGDRDATVHPSNGEQIAAAGMAASRRERGSQGRAYTRDVYRDSQGRPRAEHWVVHGAGHAWSGGRADGSYTDPQGPDASAEMLRFFFANPRA